MTPRLLAIIAVILPAVLLIAACARGGASETATTGSKTGCNITRVPGTHVGSMTHDSLMRSFRVHVPASYDPKARTPLVLNLHGYGSNARDQEAYSEMISKANATGFITAAPEGSNDPQRWHIYGSNEAGYVDDVSFVAALLDHIEASYCIDPERIYVAGMSNGGAMSIRLACDLSDRIAAVAAVAGVYTPLVCDGERKVPLIAFHGTGDELVPFDAGRAGRYSLASRGVRTAVGEWADRNGCTRESMPERIEPDVLVERFPDCQDDADVVLYVIEDGGHTWPGSRISVERFGKTTRTISATDLIWEFFEAHPKTR